MTEHQLISLVIGVVRGLLLNQPDVSAIKLALAWLVGLLGVLIPLSMWQIILALDGLQPDVGHEVLWVLRDCPSGEVLLSSRLYAKFVTFEPINHTHP